VVALQGRPLLNYSTVGYESMAIRCEQRKVMVSDAYALMTEFCRELRAKGSGGAVKSVEDGVPFGLSPFGYWLERRTRGGAGEAVVEGINR